MADVILKSADDMVYIHYSKDPDPLKPAGDLPAKITIRLWQRPQVLVKGGFSKPVKRVDAESVCAKAKMWEAPIKLTIAEIEGPAVEPAE